MLTLRRAGVSDPRVLAAIDSCRRETFIEGAFLDLAREDVSVPLPCGQTSLRPSALAMMLEALDLQPSSHLLLIGAGAGYSAAVAARIVKSVTALERYRTLADLAAANLQGGGVANARVIQADGLNGFVTRDLFDRVLLTGSVSAPPAALLAHLPESGVLVAPFMEPESCDVWRWRAGQAEAERLLSIEADPLEPGLPRVL